MVNLITLVQDVNDQLEFLQDNCNANFLECQTTNPRFITLQISMVSTKPTWEEVSRRTWERAVYQRLLRATPSQPGGHILEIWDNRTPYRWSRALLFLYFSFQWIHWDNDTPLDRCRHISIGFNKNDAFFVISNALLPDFLGCEEYIQFDHWINFSKRCYKGCSLF